MSLIHEIPAGRLIGDGSAWGYGCRDVFWLLLYSLQVARSWPADVAATVAHRVTHGGLFSTLDRRTPERWIA
jgi:hypothetical protein